jgi:hypothetical protein
MVIFIILTIVIHHNELIAHPFEHILGLSKSGAYGLGAIHPIVFTTIVYVIVYVPRFIVKLFRLKK